MHKGGKYDWIDTESLNRLIAGNCKAIARYYATAPVTRLPNNIRIGNKMGISYCITKGLFHDFSTGVGGDGIAFVQALTGCSFAEVPEMVAKGQARRKQSTAFI